MQGVLLDMFIKCIKLDVVIKSSFIGSILRIVDNINRHLISEQGFFSIVLTTTDNINYTFLFDEDSGVFKARKFDEKLFNIINDDRLEFNKQYVIKDFLNSSTRD